MKLTWVKNKEHLEEIWDCLNEEGERLAFVSQRPPYCNRGHFMGMVEIGGIGRDDNWPNYYMRLDRAQDEITAFLEWRLGKVRCVQPYGGDPAAAEDRVKVDLELYGIAFTDILTGRTLDPNGIAVHHPAEKKDADDS